MELRQYDIVLVDLDPTLGREMKKTRPCVILSPNEMNRYLQTIVVAPMTTAHKPYPTRVSIEHNTKTGWIALDQIRTIDRLRIVKNLDVLTADEIAQVKRVFQAVFVD